MADKKESGLRVAANIVLMVVLTLIATVGAQLAVAYLLLWIFGADFVTGTVGTLVFSALSYILTVVLVVIAPTWIRKAKTSREELGLKGWPTWTDIGLSIVGFIVYLAVAWVLTSLFSLFPWFDSAQEQEIGFSKTIFGLDRIIAFVALVVLAPIAEEVVFRGWLYGKVRRETSKKLGSVASIVLSAVIVSALFGLVHGQWNVGVNVFAMSLVMCGMREITGTVYAGILLHMIKNGVAFYLLFVLGIV